MITVYDYKGFEIADISEDLHSELMRYWTEEQDEFSKDIKLPVEGIDHYLCWITKDNCWDAIQAMETNTEGIKLFGQAFNNKEYALRWLAGEYDDTDELVEEDRKAGK